MEETDKEEGEEGTEPSGVSRRKFLKYATIGGAAAAIAAIGAGYFTGLIKLGGKERPPWEVAPGIVDYDKVRDTISGPVTLRVAQWFDYWPGSFLTDSPWSFQTYMKEEYNIDVYPQVEYFLSNEELFLWLTLEGREYDVIFPSNYYAVLLDKLGMIYNINRSWVPNVDNLDTTLLGVPPEDPWERRQNGDLRSLPYFWGTTGVAYRSDIFTREDIEKLGWEVFLQTSYYSPIKNEEKTLVKNMTLLEDERDVLMVGFKKAGWEWQKSQGLQPTGDLPPYGIQWTSNETEKWKVDAAGEWLFKMKPNLFDFTSTAVIPNLQNSVVYTCQAWNGDVVLAQAPDATKPWPVDYILPKEGAAWWIDAMSIPSTARNLWLAHQFMNYIHEPEVMKRLTEWNKYATTNLKAKSMLVPASNGYDMREDLRLYPDEITWRRFDLTLDVGLEVVNGIYKELWDQLAFGGG